MKIILLGKMGAGKDTVAEYLHWRYDFYQYAFADKLKQIAKELFPERFKHGKPRELLQVLGTKMREIEKDCWVNYLLRHIEEQQQKYGIENVVITDCRYYNELDICRQEGFFPVRVVANDEIRLQRLMERDGIVDPATFNHISETELDDERVYEIENNDTKEELYRRVDRLIKVIKEWQKWRNEYGSQTP